MVWHLFTLWLLISKHFYIFTITFELLCGLFNIMTQLRMTWRTFHLRLFLQNSWDAYHPQLPYRAGHCAQCSTRCVKFMVPTLFLGTWKRLFPMSILLIWSSSCSITFLHIEQHCHSLLRHSLTITFWRVCVCVCVPQTVKAFLPQMKAQNHGHIVTIASVLGLFSTACVEVKQGGRNITGTLRRDSSPVTFNQISAIETAN